MMAALSVTYLLSILLQNLLFCIPIVAVLHGKTTAFTIRNRRYYFSRELSLQNRDCFLYLPLKFTRFLGILYFLSKTASLSVSGTR